VNFHSSFDLEGSEWSAKAISALKTLHLATLTELPDGLATLLVEDIANILTHLVGELLVFFDLFLSVPEPLVNLLLFKFEIGGEVEDLRAFRRTPF